MIWLTFIVCGFFLMALMYACVILDFIVKLITAICAYIQYKRTI